MLPLILGALKFAPAVFSAGKAIFSAVTGQEPADDETPESLAGKIGALPPDEQARVMTHIQDVAAEIQAHDTERFVAMTEGDADKVRATARPEIALQAMAVIAIFGWCFRILIVATVVEWLARAGFAIAGKPFPVTDSLWSLIAEARPVSEMIWGPLVASFWVCAEVIKKYMGCRERDKAQEYEIQHGQPLSSAAATVEAAGGAVASLVKAFRR